MPAFTYNVTMTCTGCSGAVTRVLSKNPAVESFDVSLEKQSVVVNSSTLSQDEILAIIQKTGKAASIAA